MKRFVKVKVVLKALIPLLLVACQAGSPRDGAVASITVEPRTATIEAGQTQTFTAVAKDASGNPSSVSLDWRSSDETVATVADGVATAVGEGTTEVSASSGSVTSNVATLTVTSSGSSNEPPVITSFSADPTAIAPGESSTLSWRVSGATSLSISPGVGVVTGASITVQPTTTTQYTLTATNAAGQDSAMTTVSVSGNGGNVPPPVHNTIAYVRLNDTSGDEIRLVAPDGSGERLLWTHGQADPEEVHGIWSLSWKPDATELAFASTHENACSINHADVYAVGADGSGYRRVTQAPACAALADYPKGTVRVPVSRGLYGDSFVGFVYFQGAPGLQMVSLPPGGSGVVTFENVADFGDGALQMATMIVGFDREIDIGTAVAVQAGGVVTTATLNLYSPYNPAWEARAPSWRMDGSKLGYVFGFGSLYSITPNPTPLDFGELLIPHEAEMPNIVLHLTYGPTAERANQLLFQGNVFYEAEGIYLTTEGAASAGAPLVSFDSTESILGLSWLPDGSGFVYSVTEGDFFGEDRSANLFVYSFATNEATRLTSFSGEFAGPLSVSPDGQRIVFERADEQVEFSLSLADPDLWVINRDGSGLQLLVENGRAPAWSR